MVTVQDDAVDNLTFDSLAAVASAVNEAGGVLSVPMWKLRDAYGAKRLGSNVVAAMSQELSGLGLGHVPANGLPQDQLEAVRLYTHNSKVGKLIDMVLAPGSKRDELLKARAAGGSSDEGLRRALQEIRDILEDVKL